MKKRFLSAILKVMSLCVIIFAVSVFFIHDAKNIGWILLGLGILCLVALKLFRIPIRHIFPDLIFGLIDNGILVIFALVGGHLSGVVGAIIGGAVGNAITDGIAGIFEGYVAESMREKNISEERTILGSAIGKMSGCLLGAGVVFILANFL